MTTKPKVVAYHINKENPEHRGVTLEPLIRLAEYEALQAECEKLRKDEAALVEAYEAKTVASIDAKTLFDSWNERRKVKRLFRRLLRSLGRRQSPSKQ